MEHQLEQALETFTNQHHGTVITHDLFKGIKLSFVTLESGNPALQYPAFEHPVFERPDFERPAFERSDFERSAFEHLAFGHMLEINYCKSGRIIWQMGNGNSIYLGPSDFSLHTMDSCKDSRISLPDGSYVGLTFYLDLGEVSENLSELLSGTGITGARLSRKFCKNGAFTSLAGNEQTEAIFSPFFDAPASLKLPYWKLKTLELLLYLSRLELDSAPRLSEYQAEQVKTIRAIHRQLTENLDKRYTIDSLSKQYLMNATTLKKMFKAVYGTSIAAHIKMHRMETAARLLLTTQEDIIQIAESVGYESQSKFAAAFKDYFQVLPTEYRKNFRASKS